MKQERIKALLEEAASEKTSAERLQNIHKLLANASAAKRKNGTMKTSGRRAGILLVLDTLFTETVYNDYKLLPSLFPVFSLLCGNRKKGELLADIGWELINKK